MTSVPSNSLATNAPARIMADPLFTLFPKLVLELRGMIWKEALPQQRLVLIEDRTTCLDRLFPTRIATDQRLGKHFHSKTPIPALLHTCAESRRIARESGFVLAFGKDEAGENGRFWFNFDRDVLYLPSEQLGYRSPGSFVDTERFIYDLDTFIGPQQKIKRLALRSGLDGVKDIVRILPIKCFSELEEFIVVVQHCGRDDSYPTTSELREQRNDPWTLMDINQADDIDGHCLIDGQCLIDGDIFEVVRDAGGVPDFGDVVRLIRWVYYQVVAKEVEGKRVTTPSLRMRQVVPESDVQPVMRQRAEYSRKFNESKVTEYKDGDPWPQLVTRSFFLTNGRLKSYPSNAR